MTRNTALKEGVTLPETLAGRSIVLVGLMGAGKTSIGRRLAARLGLPFRDADSETELAAGCSVPELFSRYGERAFRDGERRVIRRLLAGDPLVLAFGGGAFMDPETRAAARADSVSVWLRCPLPTLVRRVSGRDHRPLLADGDPNDVEEIAHQIDELMVSIASRSSSGDSTRVAVMACLHLADKLREAENKLRLYEDRSKAIDSLLDKALN